MEAEDRRFKALKRERNQVWQVMMASANSNEVDKLRVNNDEIDK